MKKILTLGISLLLCQVAFAESYGFKDYQVTQVYTKDLKEHLTLYPLKKPNKSGFLQVSNIHKIYYAEYGNPKGLPVIYLHGGPGGGTSERMTQYFDPSFYRIILMDQRGAGKSIPHAQMNENDLKALLSDMEQIREHLKINDWLISGGSWGSTLALSYAQAHPEKVKGLVLRGVFDGTREQYLHLLYGMKKTYPEAWSDFINFLPEHERGDLIRAYYKRLMDPNPDVHMPAARAFVKYDIICGMFNPDQEQINELLKDDKFVLGVSRGFMHYAYHDFFMKKLQIRNQMNLIQDIPTVIVQGRFDTITPASNSHKIFRKSNQATMMIIQDAGHFETEPGISLGLVSAHEWFKERLKSQQA